jgi:lysyl-tRNA synthetase class 1
MEKFFWADQIADNIIKQKGKKKEYVCASGITPSGSVHIGNFREVITTDMVVRALKDKGKKVRFIYSWDDYDRFRKVPANVDSNFEKYLGMPVSEVPSPSGKKGESYARYFEKIFENSLKKVFIEPDFIYQNEMNKKCKYAKLIKLAIDKKEIIKKILDKYRKEPLKKDWVPLIVYCEKCYKDFTKILKIDNYEVEYECKCGHKDKIDFRKKGLVKLQWRVDWPMRWTYEKVDFEPGGADHSAAGGSFDTGKKIVKEVYDYEAPMYQMYEWIKIKGGKEFSSSAGNALTLDDVSEVYEPEVLRYLFCGTKPKSAFQISFDLDVIKIYEEFDSLERKYFEKKVNNTQKRMYEMSVVNVPKRQPSRTSFRHLATLVQLNQIVGLDENAKNRAEKVRNWLDKYASEDMKFEVQDKLKFEFTGKERDALIELREALKTKSFDPEGLFNEFYDICQKFDIKNTEFFKAAYQAIIGKEKGPRLAEFILQIGKDKVIKILNQIK